MANKLHNDNLIGIKINRLTIIEPIKEKGKRLYWRCLCDCGKEAKVRDDSLRSGDTKSCGCFAKDFITQLSYKQSGPNHPSWKGGNTTEREQYMGSKEYKDWRCAVFARDNFICQKCSNGSNQLRAHHIFPFANYIELRLDLNNGITFCNECHKKFHNTYGNKDFGCKELQEFINDKF